MAATGEKPPFVVGTADGYFDLENVVLTVQVANGRAWLVGVSPGFAAPAPVLVADGFGLADVQMHLFELVRAANRHRFRVEHHGGQRVA